MKVQDFTYYIPTGLIVAFILYATWVPHPAGADELPAIPYIDKWIHALMMGTLLTVFAFDWQRAHRQERLTPSFMWAVFGCVLSFSIFDEFMQGYIDNGRAADPWDFMADCAGALVAVYVAPPLIRLSLHLKLRQQHS